VPTYHGFYAVKLRYFPFHILYDLIKLHIFGDPLISESTMSSDQIVIKVPFDFVFQFADQSFRAGPYTFKLYLVAYMAFIAIDPIVSVRSDSKTGPDDHLILIVQEPVSPEIKIHVRYQRR
jgi:hypothetical protein